MQTQSELLTLRQLMQSLIVGQLPLIDRILIGVLTGRHLLLEGPPRLANTTAMKTLATRIDASFRRRQFIPDLMPSDQFDNETLTTCQIFTSLTTGPVGETAYNVAIAATVIQFYLVYTISCRCFTCVIDLFIFSIKKLK